MNLRTLFTLVLSAALALLTCQTSIADDRSQLPSSFIHSYVGLDVGYFHTPYSNADLKNGFSASSVDNPNLAARISVGHYFNPYIALQVSLTRPFFWTKYKNVSGSDHTVWLSQFAVCAQPTLPLTHNVSLYADAGVGLLSRHGFDIGSTSAIDSKVIPTFVTGAGVFYTINKNWRLNLASSYALARPNQNQPSVLYVGMGFNYVFTPLLPSTVNAPVSVVFPHQMVQAGFLYSPMYPHSMNNFLTSDRVPLFFTGAVKMRSGLTLMYQRNFFHTQKWFSMSWGGSISRWTTEKQSQSVYAFSLYPMMRLWFLRTHAVDAYFMYEIAGPTFLTRSTFAGRDTGEHFTFQDMIGFGFLLGQQKRVNLALRIMHYSNGNLFPNNPGLGIPLTIALGYRFN